MFGRKKQRAVINNSVGTKETRVSRNKMDEKQKQAFLKAMSDANNTDNYQEGKYTSRSERNTNKNIEYTQKVAPISIQAEDVNKAKKMTNIEQTTIMMNLNNVKDNVTIDDLYDALAKVQDYQSSDYTTETWLPFVDTFKHALVVYQSEEPTTSEILIAIDALQISAKQLVKK